MLQGLLPFRQHPPSLRGTYALLYLALPVSPAIPESHSELSLMKAGSSVYWADSVAAVLTLPLNMLLYTLSGVPPTARWGCLAQNPMGCSRRLVSSGAVSRGLPLPFFLSLPALEHSQACCVTLHPNLVVSFPDRVAQRKGACPTRHATRGGVLCFPLSFQTHWKHCCSESFSS